MDDAIPRPEGISEKNWLMFMTTANGADLDFAHPHDVTLEEVHQARGGSERNRYAPHPSNIGADRPKLSRPESPRRGEPPSERNEFDRYVEPNERGGSRRPDSPGHADRLSPVASSSIHEEDIGWRPYVEPSPICEQHPESKLPPYSTSPMDEMRHRYEDRTGSPSEAGPSFLESDFAPLPPDPFRDDDRNDRDDRRNSPGSDDPGRPDKPSFDEAPRNSTMTLPPMSPSRFEAELRRPDRSPAKSDRSPSRRFSPEVDRTSSSGRSHREEQRQRDEDDRRFRRDSPPGSGGRRSGREEDSPSRRSGGESPRTGRYDDFSLPTGVRRFEETRNERFLKKELLAELDELRLKGFKPTEEYTIDSDLHDLRWEVNRLNDIRYRLNKTRQWSYRISKGVRLVEHIDREYGPKLYVGGVSEDIEKELGGWNSILDEPLDRIFKRSRRGEGNPYMEIAGALAAPLGLRIFTNLFLKGRKNEVLYGMFLGDRQKGVSGPEPPPNQPAPQYPQNAFGQVPPGANPNPYAPTQTVPQGAGGIQGNGTNPPQGWYAPGAPNYVSQPTPVPYVRGSPRATPTEPLGRGSPRAVPLAQTPKSQALRGDANEATASAWASANDRAARDSLPNQWNDPNRAQVRRRPKVPPV